MPTHSSPTHPPTSWPASSLSVRIPDVLALRPRSVATDLAKLTHLNQHAAQTQLFHHQLHGRGPECQSAARHAADPVRVPGTHRQDHPRGELRHLEQDGSVQPSGDAKDGTRGVKIVFSGTDAKQQTLYYFRTDLSQRGVQSSGFLQFCRQFGIGDVFIKAASYLLHTPGFSIVRDFLLGHGATVVQDDTGVPLKYFEQRGWEVRPFGRYVGPIPVFRGNYQVKAQDLFEKANRAADRLRHRLPVAHQPIARAARGEQEACRTRDQPPGGSNQEDRGEKECATGARSRGGNGAVRQLAFASHGRPGHRRPRRPARTAGTCRRAGFRSADGCSRRRCLAGIHLLQEPKRFTSGGRLESGSSSLSRLGTSPLPSCAAWPEARSPTRPPARHGARCARPER